VMKLRRFIQLALSVIPPGHAGALSAFFLL